MAKRKKKRIASRGSVNNIILKSLIEGDKYGYEIIKDVESYSNGKIQLKQPSLYSSLSRFEDKGYVSSYWGDSEIGGRRHYYHLTDNGIAYYQKAVLKITDNDNQEILEDNFDDTENQDNSPIETIEVENVTEIITDDEDEDNDDFEITEIVENEIPAIVDFETNEEIEEPPVYDHLFHQATPIEQNIFENDYVNTNSKPWLELSTPVKNNNKIISQTSNKKLHYLIPKKQKKVVLDKDGLYKLRDIDYVPSQHRDAKPKIIDNVIKRTKDTGIYGYSSYTDKTNETKTSIVIELTEEEKRRKNEIFVEKFNTLTNSKVSESNNSNNNNYQEKLNLLMNMNNEPEETFLDTANEYEAPTPRLFDNSAVYHENENQMFNYEDNDVEITSNVIEEDDDRFIDFEPEEFETKNENKQYIQEISNYTAPVEQVKVSRYVNNSSAILQDKSYVLINKVNCIFGFILAFILLAELTISYFIFKNNGLIFKGDNTLYIVAYSFTIILSLCYIVPVLINPSTHKLNSFKLKYAMIFGILTFLVCIILVYCFNTLIGFELDNLKYYSVKLFVPTILAFNFIILPPIYSSLIKNRRFYD